MKIGVIGTRGFPDVQGGIETHCLELYSRMARLDDHRITVYRRTPYLNQTNRYSKLQNISFVDIPVPKSKNLETVLHSFLASIHALFQRYDVVHFHNTGPGFFIPLLKLTRARVLFTYHNISYTQTKWNTFAKLFLNFSEKISLKLSDFVIFISDIIRTQMLEKYDIKNHKVISNGVNLPRLSDTWEYLDTLGLEKRGYIISVGRFLEEKGFDYLIRSYKKANLDDIKLVIVGDTDYPTEYSVKLKRLAEENGVVLTGYIKGEKLNQIYSFARLFIMSSFEEGMPIALLEAMSYNIEVLASNIPANLKVGLDEEDYFTAGDEEDLKNKIRMKVSREKEINFRNILENNFNWDKIALDTEQICKDLITKHGRHFIKK